MSFSDYLENKVLDHLFGNAAYTAPANIYVGLSKADPLDDASGLSEVTGGSYTRVSTAASDWTAASGGELSNGTAIAFPAPTADWGTITHVCLFDAASGVNLLASTPLPMLVLVSNGSVAPTFQIGDITITLT